MVRKSGNVTIKLGPKEVQDILSGRDTRRGRYGTQPTVMDKVTKAVRETFTNVAADMAQENLVHVIQAKVYDSKAWDEVMEPFRKAHRALMDKHRGESSELYRQQHKVCEKMLQVAFDEAGITEFVADGSSFRRVVEK